MLERTPSEAGRFAYTLNGKRTVVDLDPGDSVSLRLLAYQRRSLSLEPLAGKVSLVTSWEAQMRPESVVRDANMVLGRTYTPFPTVSDDEMVEVRLTATFGPHVLAVCHGVSDLVPFPSLS